VACHGKIAKKRLFIEDRLIIWEGYPQRLQTGGVTYEYLHGHPDPASGHKILCTHVLADADLASSPDWLARREPQVPLHTHFGSCRLRQDDVALDLGAIAACKWPLGGLGVSGRGGQ